MQSKLISRPKGDPHMRRPFEGRKDEKAFARLGVHDSLWVRRDGDGDCRPVLAVSDRRVTAQSKQSKATLRECRSVASAERLSDGSDETIF
jgi:hypothetical protein